MHSNERREKLLRILSMRGLTSAKELAEELEVSERTVYRDVDALSIAKPIGTLCGRFGGIYLINPRVLQKGVLTQDELALLERLAKRLGQGGSEEEQNDLILLRKMIAGHMPIPGRKKRKNVT